MEVETDPSFLASVYKCFADSVRVIGGPGALAQQFRDGVMSATTNQLQVLAEKRKMLAQETEQERQDREEDLALMEELEDFALEDMAKLLQYLDPSTPLLVAVSSVKDLGLRGEDETNSVGEDG